jgi:hypothetical protein
MAALRLALLRNNASTPPSRTVSIDNPYVPTPAELPRQKVSTRTTPTEFQAKPVNMVARRYSLSAPAAGERKDERGRRPLPEAPRQAGASAG